MNMPAYKKISPLTGRASWFASFYYTDWTGKKRQKKKEGFVNAGTIGTFDDFSPGNLYRFPYSHMTQAPRPADTGPV